MSRKSARKERFAENNPDLVGKEQEGEEVSEAAAEATGDDDTPTETVVEEPTKEAGAAELKDVPLTPEEATEVTEPIADPLDVNGDGKVDTEDVLAVAEGAAAEEASEEAPVEEPVSEEAPVEDAPAEEAASAEEMVVTEETITSGDVGNVEDVLGTEADAADAGASEEE